MSTSYSVFPDSLDGYSSLPLVVDGVTEITARDHNSLRDAIVKIEQELGTNPSGSYATVRDRLDDVVDTTALIVAHVASTTGAHAASAISTVDSSDYFYSSNVESSLQELASLLPAKPNVIGANNPDIPNSGVGAYIDGYGVKFVYNVSDWSSEATDNDVLRTQPRPTVGCVGFHIFDLSETTPNGVGLLTYTNVGTTLQWQAPGDGSAGTAVDVSSLDAGDEVRVYSNNTAYSIRVARTADSLPNTNREDYFEVYALDQVEGTYSLPTVGFVASHYITRTAIGDSGVSRCQFMFSGIVFPADKGTLVLQRKLRTSAAFYPIAVLALGTNFTEADRSTKQGVYIPSLVNYDCITLFDRYPALKAYTDKDASGNNVYDDYTIDYYGSQVAKYLIPASNSQIVGGELEAPAVNTFSEYDTKVASYRIVHYKAGITNFDGDPASGDVYSVRSLLSGNDHDDTVRISNVVVDTNGSRPGIEGLVLTPVSVNAVVERTLSGIRYYGSASDLFDLELKSNDGVFSNTYKREDILTLVTDAFNIPSGVAAGKFGDKVDVDELFDDGYSLFSASNLPTNNEKALYTINAAYNTARRLSVAPDSFSSRAHITAYLADPFGYGDGYDGYGCVIAERNRQRILVNGYGVERSTETTEYFTDETFRVGNGEEFLFETIVNGFTYNQGIQFDGYHGSQNTDGYQLRPWYSADALVANGLQCGARLTSDEFDICGLIYPQDDYTTGLILPLQGNEQTSTTDGLIANTLLPSYDGYNDQDKYYQRLFSIGYPSNGVNLRIVSGGNNPIAFEDIRYGNASRFGKIEIKIPGDKHTWGTDWMDAGRLYSSDGLGCLAGVYSGTTGDFTIPLTFGTKNNADSGDMVAVRVTYFGSTAGKVAASKLRIITMIQIIPL